MQKKYILFIFLIMVLAFIGYCSTRTSQKKATSNTLVVAFDAKIISTDPRMIGSDAGSQYVEELRFLPLISFGKDGSLTKVLAHQIRFKGKDIIVTLKKGVHFANGSEITSADVESTYNAIINPEPDSPPTPRKGLFLDLVSVKTRGAWEVIFTLKNPDASFVNNFVVGILPKRAAETEPIGDLIGKNYESGPFILTKKEETKWHFAVNKTFDYGPAPKLKAFDIEVIPDSTTRYAALMKGDIDLIQNSLDPDKIYLIENKMKDSFAVLKNTKLATTYIGFNFRDPILKQKNVREVLAYAIDAESILKYRLRSDETRANGMFPENSFYFHPNLAIVSLQKEKAISLLKATNLKLPIALTLTVSSSNKTNVEIAKTIAMSLKDIGFDIKVETLENSVFFQHLNRGITQMWLAPWVGFKDPDHLRFIFSSSMFPPSGANRGHYSNSAVDALLEKGRIEFNASKRKDIYLKAQELISNDMPYLFLWHGSNVAVMSKRVHGFELYADGRYWSLTHTSLDQ